MLLYFGQLVTLNFERFREELNGFFFGDLMRYYHQIYSISTISIFKYFSQLIDLCNKAEQHQCTQVEAEKIVDTFTSSVVDALGKGNEISLIGFGNFSVSKVAARSGRNPRTGEALEIAAYNQPKFKVGQKLKDAVNPK